MNTNVIQSAGNSPAAKVPIGEIAQNKAISCKKGRQKEEKEKKKREREREKRRKEEERRRRDRERMKE